MPQDIFYIVREWLNTQAVKRCNELVLLKFLFNTSMPTITYFLLYFFVKIYEHNYLRKQLLNYVP